MLRFFRGADQLYSGAKFKPLDYGFRGLGLGGLLGFGIGAIQQGKFPDPVIFLLLPAVVCLILGIGVGVLKGDESRLEAQRIVCLLKIEKNTRATGGGR